MVYSLIAVAVSIALYIFCKPTVHDNSRGADSTRLADLFAEIDDAGMRLSLEEQGEFMRGLYAGRKPKLEKLALLRQEKGLSQKALAEKVEISLSTLRKYEIGERNLRFAKAEVVQKIAVVLGCRMEDLL